MKINYSEYIEKNTLRCEASYRGGGIEIDLSELFPKVENACMTAYQNYLGGGMLGSICNSYNFRVQELGKGDTKKLSDITQAVNKYYHSLTNHEGDEWEETTYERNQLRPESAY